MERVFSEKRLSDRDNLILTCFALYAALGLFTNSAIGLIDKVKLMIDALRVMIFLLFAVDILIDLFTKKLKISYYMILFGVLSLLITYQSKHPHMMILLLFLLVLRKFDFNLILKTALRSYLLTFVYIIALAVLGIFPNGSDLRITMSGNTVLRYQLGFQTATLGPAYLMFIVLMFVMYRKTAANYLEIALLFVINVCLFLLTNTRFDFVLVSLLLVLIFVCKLLKNKIKLNPTKFKFVRYAIYSLPIIALVVNLVLVFLYTRKLEFMYELNRLLSNRLFYTYQTIKTQKFTLFGTSLNLESVLLYPQEDLIYGKIVLDSSYFSILYNYGLIGFFISLVLYIVSIYMAIKNKDYWICFALVFCLFEGIIGPFLMDYNYNVGIFYIASYLFSNKKYREVKYEG